MSDHWGGFDHHDDDGFPDLNDHHDLGDLNDHHDLPDLPDDHDLGDDHDPGDPAGHHDAGHFDEHHDPDPDLGQDLGHDGGHDLSDTTDPFPPTLDVGDLPEPVDGFPWIDAATLGTPHTYDTPADPIDPHELAAQAGIDIPDGSDPWATLAASDDPAVSALARWWTPDPQ